MSLPYLTTRTFTSRIVLLAIALNLLVEGISVAAENNFWQLTSPDGRCSISVALDSGRLGYEVRRVGRIVIQTSQLGLLSDDQELDHSLIFDRAEQIENRREKYELFAGTLPHVDHMVNHRTLVFHNSKNVPIEIELAASDEGVAFRYKLTGIPGELRIIKSESTSFTIPANARGWMQPYHAAGPYTPAYEDFYFHVSPGDPPPNSRAKAVGWAFPALFKIPDADTWVLLTEAGTDESYCACHLAPDCTGGIYQIAFPLADETTQGYANKFGPEPRYALPWAMPWRVMVLGKSAGDIATATLVTDLSAPSRIADTSWIKPGRASWAWWSYPDGPATKQSFDEFTDFAAKMGWEYTLFDAGWWTPSLGSIASHALAKNVRPLAWNQAGDFYEPIKRAKKLDEMVAAGVVGVKVDFWCSDRQEAIAAQQGLMRDAAARHMVVNLHGCTIPRGWQRTWPNVLSTEAVLGNESYFYEPRYTQKAAELNTVLPFTRNAIGPMDLTPVALSPKKYDRTTTAAHELAAAIIFTSGIIHYADKPEAFEGLPPEALQVFRDAPARWDETKCLVGEPGQIAVFARRDGPSWFIAGINGTGDMLPVNLDLSAFKELRHRLMIAEGRDAKMKVAVTPLENQDAWTHQIPPRGGFILRLDK
jgi:alpha-glucosidase